MLITSIDLQNFRNYKTQKIELSPNINIFYGDNAQGKTNIIESIFLTGFGKSFRTNKDKELINKESDFCNILINYKNNKRDGKIKIQISDKKIISVNGVKIKKLSELLGTINIVLFSPDDINILKEGPAKRRKFLDMMIGQIRPKYIYNLNNYLKVLEERNNYLKQINNSNYDENLLEIFDEKLAEYGEIIYKYRKEFINKIQLKIIKIHKEITANKEEIEIKYESSYFNKEKFLEKLKSKRKLDIIKGYTTEGIQKDDFVIYINEEQLNIFGSQGQHRTAILSLKLCELDILKEETLESPILLLDDFMSELDEKRINNFLNYIKDIQVIITCTDEIKIEEISKKVFYVKNGQTEELKKIL